jgi:uncharacterized protein with HEPN domain
VSGGGQRGRHEEYLEHIIAAIEKVQSYTAALDKAEFVADEKTQDAVIRNLEVIGEAAGRIIDESPEIAARYAEVPWKTIYAMRNRLSHGYFEINLEIVWETVCQSLPELERQARRILRGDNPRGAAPSEPAA